MEALILGIITAVLEAGPGIYEAVRSKDGDLAKRRLREATDRVIDVALAKRRLRQRKAKT